MKLSPCVPDAGGRYLARIARMSYGRRIFTDQFKRQQIDRVRRGELTLAELSRKQGIARSLLQRWKRLMPEGHESAGAARTRVSQARELGSVQYIRELHLLVGKQTLELEQLRTELDKFRNGRRALGASRL